MVTITQPRNIVIADRTTGGSATVPKAVADWSRRAYRHCPRCDTGRLFISKSLAADGGHWVANCINCGLERDIP